MYTYICASWARYDHVHIYIYIYIYVYIKIDPRHADCSIEVLPKQDGHTINVITIT